MSDSPKFNTQDPEAVEIRRKVAAIGMELYDVIDIKAVRAFEAEASVKLPEDYVWFITNVGNGGTWRTDYKFPFIPLTTAEEALFACSENGDEKYALCVIYCDYGYYDGIVLRGECFGEICTIENKRVRTLPENKIYVHSFKEMYNAWLETAYMGYDNEQLCLYRHPGIVDELFDKYLDNRDIEFLQSIFVKINKKVAKSEFIDRVHTEFLRETDNDKQAKLCDILMKSGYDDPFSLIKRIYCPENYRRIINYLDYDLKYFEHWLDAEGVMDGAEVYYPMLVEILKYFNTLSEFPFEGLHFKKCFEMTVMNPEFNENDIMEVLKSKNKLILEIISWTYAETVKSRVGKYIKAAEKKAK